MTHQAGDALKRSRIVTVGPDVVIAHLRHVDGTGDEDFLDTLAETVRAYSRWELKHLPIGRFDSGHTRNEDIIDEYADLPSETAPAIVAVPADEPGESRLDVIDGGHRHQAAEQRGDRTILAYVPVRRR